jgi:hypothetical protein
MDIFLWQGEACYIATDQKNAVLMVLALAA